MDWLKEHKLAETALGSYGKVATLEKTLCRKLCAALYSEYVCLDLPFPNQCTDMDGNYNVDEYPKQIV